MALDRQDTRILSTAANGTTALWVLSGSGALALAASPAALTYPNTHGVPRRSAAAYVLSRTASFFRASNLARYFLAAIRPPIDVNVGLKPASMVTVDISTGRRLDVLRTTAAAAGRLVGPHRNALIFEVAPLAAVEQEVIAPQLGIVDFQGRYVATTSFLGDVLLWNARSGALVGKPLIALGPTATALAFSTNGHELAVGRSDGTITRYAVPSLEQIANTVIGQTSPISQIAYQPHSSLLAAARSDSTKMIDLSSDETVAVIPFVTDEAVHSDEAPGAAAPAANQVQFSASGDQLLTSGVSKIGPATPLLWSMHPSHWVRAACQVAGRNLSRAEWNQIIGRDKPYHRTCPQWPAGT